MWTLAEARTEHVFELAGVRDPLNFCGHLDRNLSALEGLVPVTVNLDGDRLRLSGAPDAVRSATGVLERMRDAANGGAQLTPDDVALAAREAGGGVAAPRSHPKTLLTSQRGKDIRPKTVGQRRFVETVERCTLTFGIGPAGTGKTFLAVVMAVRALRAREVARIILTRPAVEAGEKLGFLPGDLKDKVDPYLRPLYDALAELLDDGVTSRFMERGTIEVAPLAYMRGRTLSDAFVILDEAQNATREQLKMFLTRLGRQLEDDRQRRRHADRSAARHPLRAARRRAPFRRYRRHRHRRIDGIRRRTAPAGGEHHPRLCLGAAAADGMIYLRNATRTYALSPRRIIRTTQTLLTAIDCSGASVSLTFVGDTAMRRLNREHRGRDRTTDVLSFPLFEPFAVPKVTHRPHADASDEPEVLLGDIVISLNVAARQARDYDVPLEAELSRLLIHGIAHLLGHDHEAPQERRRMVALEQKLAAAIDLKWPYDGEVATSVRSRAIRR